jgi:hypothetical protein
MWKIMGVGEGTPKRKEGQRRIAKNGKRPGNIMWVCRYKTHSLNYPSQHYCKRVYFLR